MCRRSAIEPVVENAGHLETVLREHGHPLDQQLAARAGADHQDAFGADAAAPQARLVLAKKVALDGHQHEGDDDRIGEREPRVFEATIERHAGEGEHGGERAAAAHREELVNQCPPAP